MEPLLLSFLELLLLLITFRAAAATCGQCSSSYNTQCDSANTFRLCNPLTKLAIGQRYTCPVGYLCSTETGPNPCSESVTRPECICNFCLDNFACISGTQYFKCDEPRNILSCPENTICSPGSTSFCEENVENVCPLACTQTGRFPTPSTGCKGYYMCARATNGTITRTIFTCPGTSVFNPGSQKCVTSYVCPG